MSTRRSSGLFETLIKSVFGFGTTVHHSTDWRGRRTKVVLHHDTGRSSTTVRGCGFWGDITRTEKCQGGRVYEQGETRHGLWGAKDKVVHRDNGTTVESESGKGFWGNHGSRHVHGRCWSCHGTGVFQKTGKPCRKCAGSGRYSKFRQW
ncbi:MAG: hypothetical protein EBS01_16420 [Verrucomicrobia bacterium]|nr:hypothetical protein [Verrucomicrobiota bacterium]